MLFRVALKIAVLSCFLAESKGGSNRKWFGNWQSMLTAFQTTSSLSAHAEMTWSLSTHAVLSCCFELLFKAASNGGKQPEVVLETGRLHCLVACWSVMLLLPVLLFLLSLFLFL